MSVALVTTVVAACGYLLGSVPVAVLVGRRHSTELRSVGDRNPGYWNAKEQLGRRAAVPVFVGDALKGALAAAIGLAGVAVADATPAAWWIGHVAVGGAMVGHAWPLFAGFRGGRSILTFAGGVVVLSPLAGLAAIAACVAVSLATRRFAYGARVGVFGFPVLQLLVDPATHVAATGVLMSLIGLRFAQAALAGRREAPRPTRPDRSGPATGVPDAGPTG